MKWPRFPQGHDPGLGVLFGKELDNDVGTLLPTGERGALSWASSADVVAGSSGLRMVAIILGLCRLSRVLWR
jgi:hypothetical protein